MYTKTKGTTVTAADQSRSGTGTMTLPSSAREVSARGRGKLPESSSADGPGEGVHRVQAGTAAKGGVKDKGKTSKRTLLLVPPPRPSTETSSTAEAAAAAATAAETETTTSPSVEKGTPAVDTASNSRTVVSRWTQLSSVPLRDLIQAVKAGTPLRKLKSKTRPSRTASLTVPGDVAHDGGGGLDGAGPTSVHTPNGFLEKRMSSVDFSKLQASHQSQSKPEEEKEVKAPLLNDDMYIRAVIPYLPMWLAVVCLLLNVCAPGTGTMLSGFSVYCCAHSRVKSKEDTRMRTCCMNIMVGVMQMFTVTFMLVGWFWSLVWGIYMIILAVERAKQEKIHREKELEAKALTLLNGNLRPWTLMRT